MNKNILLIRTLLLSTSQINSFKYCNDKKKRGKIVGSIIGVVVLYLLIMAFAVLMCIGYGYAGLIDSAPLMCALIISVLAFILTLFKTNGYLFNFKEYDMLMSLPFEPRKIAGCKFLYMYIKSLAWHLSISVAMMIGYGIYAKPAFYVYIIWFILTFFVPIIPTLLASFIGFIIARIFAGFKKKNILQTVFTFIFVIAFFALRFVTQDVLESGKIKETMQTVSQITSEGAKAYLPAGWFTDAVTKTSISGMLLLIGLSVLLFTLLFLLVGGSYRSINSKLKNHAAARNFKMTAQKKKSVINTIAYKEFKRLTGSSTYMVNGAMGVVLITILSIVILVLGFDSLISMMTRGAHFDHAVVRPAIPFIIYFFIGMVSTTCCSPSLEGKNYWIIQSLPIEKKTVYLGKMLFNMYLDVPVMIFSTICICISAGVPILETILYLILGFVLCSFSTAWGCACGIKHIKLEWENEIEVVKQGAAVTIYLLPNMFACMAVAALSVFLGINMDHNLLAVIMIAIVGVLALLSYLRVMSLVKKQS